MPDAHQIVEHCFAGFKPFFIQKVYSSASPAATSPAIQKLLREEWKVFGSICDSKGSLKKNADSLPATLEAIAMPEAQYVSVVDQKVRTGCNGSWVPNLIS
jgi:hypothetical protein